MESEMAPTRSAPRSLAARIVTVLIVAFAASAYSASPAITQPEPKLTADIAYDQIGKVLPHATQAPPPADSFAADSARIAALPPLPSAKGLYAAAEAISALGSNPMTGMLAGPASMALGAATSAYQAKVTAVGQAYLNAGVMMRFAFYRGWTRADMPRLQSATIAKPDQGLDISLDLSRRTYRVKHTQAQSAGEDTYVVSTADNVVVAFSSAPTSVALPPLVLAGFTSRGYQTDATFSLSAPLGYCSTGSHVLREVEFVADAPDPQYPAGAALDGSHLAREACLPTSGASHREPGRLVLFRSMTLSGGGLYGDIVTVVERGNLRPVTAADAAMFSAPPDFKEAQ
jgi:hypothetical protein